MDRPRRYSGEMTSDQLIPIQTIHCLCKFYDLEKALAICPKCDANQDVSQKGKRKFKVVDVEP